MKEIKLKDIKGIEVFDGLIIGRKESMVKNYTYQVLTNRAIEFGIIDSDYNRTLDTEKLIDENRLTKEGDIVLKKSFPFDSCYIPKEYSNYLTSTFSVIIRNSSKEIDTGYLLAYLNSKYAFNEINKLFENFKSKIILSKRQYLEMNIVLPDLETQIKIGKKYFENIERIRETKNVIKENASLVDNLFNEIKE